MTQTVYIPADRRTIEVPREVPVGWTLVAFTPKAAEQEQKKEEKLAKTTPENGRKTIGMTRKELDEFLKNAHTPHSDALVGLLSGIGDITAEQIREERLSKKYPEYFK